MEVVASLSQGHTAAAQCGLFTHKLVPVIFEPPCIRQAYENLKMWDWRKVTDQTVCSCVGTARHQDGLQERTVYGGFETTLKTTNLY